MAAIKHEKHIYVYKINFTTLELKVVYENWP